jgi:hypothetical protein
MIDFKITIVATSPIVEIFPYHEDDVATIGKVITEIVSEIVPENDEPKGLVFSASGSDVNDDLVETESDLIDELKDEDE